MTLGCSVPEKTTPFLFLSSTAELNIKKHSREGTSERSKARMIKSFLVFDIIVFGKGSCDGRTPWAPSIRF